MKRLSSQTDSRRAGIVTVMVLLVLILIAGLIAEFVRRAVADRRQFRAEHQHQQATLLVEAGIRRLRASRTADDSYAGETWQIPAGVVHDSNTGSVEISIADNTAVVTASYPANQDIPFRVTRSVRLSP